MYVEDAYGQLHTSNTYLVSLEGSFFHNNLYFTFTFSLIFKETTFQIFFFTL